MNRGYRLKMWREKCGLTQEEVAEMTGISRNMLSSYESNRASIPISAFIKLASIYKFDIFDILGVYDTIEGGALECDISPHYLIKAHARFIIDNETEVDKKFGIDRSDEYYEERLRLKIIELSENPIYISHFGKIDVVEPL